MKKKLVTVLLAASMLATMLAGCGSGNGGSGDKKADGSVYMLNFKPETDLAWQDLAETYTEQTGVPVTVVTAADGQYKTQLQSELAKKEAPTIFNIGSTADCAEYDKYIYDLKDTDIYKHLNDKSLALEYDGKIASVANCYECYGIIYNKAILENYCKNYPDAVIKSVDDIKDLDTLEKVATDINTNVDAINEACGTKLLEAFASSGLDDGSSWRFSGHLAGVELYYEFKDAGCDLTAGQDTIKGTYMDNYKRVWDMYTNTSGADKATLDSGSLNAESEFGMEEAVFYQNGTWEYGNLTNEDNGYLVTADDMGMMPIYIGAPGEENQGLCTGSENYWCVNKQASEEDIQATLDFLSWVINSDEGRDSMAHAMGFTTPFLTFTGDYVADNVFIQDANQYIADGKTPVSWNFSTIPSETWKDGVGSALLEYAQGTGDWDAVVSAFVDGWATEYAAANGQ